MFSLGAELVLELRDRLLNASPNHRRKRKRSPGSRPEEKARDGNSPLPQSLEQKQHGQRAQEQVARSPLQHEQDVVNRQSDDAGIDPAPERPRMPARRTLIRRAHKL